MSVLDLLRLQLDRYTDIPKPVRASMASACDEIERLQRVQTTLDNVLTEVISAAEKGKVKFV